MADRDGFRRSRVIGNLHPETDKGRFCLIFAALKADTAALVNKAFFMMEERFRHYGCIQEL